MPTATLPTVTPDLADEIMTGWLRGTPVAGWDNPAGPRFTSGDYAIQEITMTGSGNTLCSLCTGSCSDVVCC